MFSGRTRFRYIDMLSLLWGRRKERKSPRAPVAVNSTEPAKRYQIEGVAVEDFSVSEEYPGSIRQVFFRLNWPLSPLPDGQVLNVFDVPDGIVARFYLTIDPNQRRLFINQLYDDILVMYPLSDLTDGSSFTFKPRDIETVSGRVVVIGGPVDLNYYHWMFSWFSRLLVLEMLAPHVYNDPSVRFMIDVRAKDEPYAAFLRALNIDFDRIFWSDCNANYKIERMVLVSFLSQNSYYPEIIRALSARLKQGVGWIAGARRRRLWISRQKLNSPKRRVANMAEIAPVLGRYGFEEVNAEDLDLASQIALFAEAEMIAGVHGAGLANMVFCPADCGVLLIEKDFNVTVGLDRTFATLAQACGLRHEVILVPSHLVEGVDYGAFFNQHHADVLVPPEALAAALDRMVRGLRGQIDKALGDPDHDTDARAGFEGAGRL